MPLYIHRALNPGSFPPEIIPYDQWLQLKPELKSVLSGWITGAFRIAKKEMKESVCQQLHFILSTAPIWDRCACYAPWFDNLISPHS